MAGEQMADLIAREGSYSSVERTVFRFLSKSRHFLVSRGGNRASNPRQREGQFHSVSCHHEQKSRPRFSRVLHEKLVNPSRVLAIGHIVGAAQVFLRFLQPVGLVIEADFLHLVLKLSQVRGSKLVYPRHGRRRRNQWERAYVSS